MVLAATICQGPLHEIEEEEAGSYYRLEGGKDGTGCGASHGGRGGRERGTPLPLAGKGGWGGRGGGTAAPRKRKQAMPGSSSAPERTKVYFAKFQNIFLFYVFLVSLNMPTKSGLLC